MALNPDITERTDAMEPGEIPADSGDKHNEWMAAARRLAWVAIALAGFTFTLLRFADVASALMLLIAILGIGTIIG